MGPHRAIRWRRKEPVDPTFNKVRINIQMCTNEAGMPHARVV
jgi:hypothetical protein